MAEKAQIINDGERQTVRLPDGFRFPDDQHEVIVRREGDRVVLEPVRSDEWPAEFLATFGSIDEDIPRLPQTPITELKNPFD